MSHLAFVLFFFPFAKFVVHHDCLVVSNHYPVGPAKAESRMKNLCFVDDTVFSRIPFSNLWIRQNAGEQSGYFGFFIGIDFTRNVFFFNSTGQVAKVLYATDDLVHKCSVGAASIFGKKAC